MWRTDSLEKTLMLGKTEGRRRRGWQKMRWLECITVLWTGSWNKKRTLMEIPLKSKWRLEFHFLKRISSVQFSSVAQSCLTLCDPMNCSTPGLPVHHQLPEFTQTHIHRVGDAIHPSHPLSSPSPVFNLSQHQGLFQWVRSLHQVAKVLEFQLQHQSVQ